MRSQTITQTTTSKCQRRNCFSTKSQLWAILHDETDCMRYSRACPVGLHGRCSHNTVSCQPTVDLPHIRSATCRGVPTIRPVAIRFRVLSVSHRLLTSRRAGRIVSAQRTDTRHWLTRVCVTSSVTHWLTSRAPSCVRPSAASSLTSTLTHTLHCTALNLCVSVCQTWNWVIGSLGQWVIWVTFYRVVILTRCETRVFPVFEKSRR